MEASSSDWEVRVASGEDCALAVELMLSAEQGSLVDVFGDGNLQKAKQFLRHAWHYPYCEFGYKQHVIACYKGKPVGLCTFWQKGMPEHFTKDTSRAVVDFYTLEEATQIAIRATAKSQYLNPAQDDELIIGHIAIAPEFRRKGGGAALLQYGEQRAAQASKVWLSLDVGANNHAAVALYKKYGFSSVANVVADSNVIHMRKAIVPQG